MCVPKIGADTRVSPYPQSLPVLKLKLQQVVNLHSQVSFYECNQRIQTTRHDPR